MATNKNFEVKNGLTIAGTERISSAGAFTGSLASTTTATTQSATDNSTKIATTAYTDAAITAVIGGAPGTLDTLNELAAAINDDASYASTLTTALATKAPLASPTFTGTLTLPGSTTGTRTIKDSYSSGALANQGFLRSSGGNYWGYSTYQDGSSNWKSAVSTASERSVYAIDEDQAYWSHAPSQTVSIGGDLTTQPAKKVVFDLENGRVGIGVTSPGARLELDNPSSFTNMIEYGNVTWNQNSGHGLVAVNRGSDGYVQLQLTSGVDDSDVFTIRNSGTGANVQHNLLSNGNVYHAGNVGIGTTSPAAPLDVKFVDNTNAQRWSYGSSEDNFYLELDTAIPGSGVVTYNFNTKNNGTLYNNNLVLDRGNVGIGTTAPSTKLHVDTETDNAYGIRLSGRTNNGSGVWTGIGIGGETSNTKSAIIFQDIGSSYSRGKLLFCVNNDQDQSNADPGDARLTIQNDGNVGIGTTAPGRALDVSHSAGQHIPVLRLSGMSTSAYSGGLSWYSGYGPKETAEMHSTASGSQGGEWWLNVRNQNTNAQYRVMSIDNVGRLRLGGVSAACSGAFNVMGEFGNSYDAIQFYHNSATLVGRIRTAASSTSYNTSSDYRLKENVDYTWDATTRLKQLKPARFNFIADDTNTLVDGFLAHEVSSIVPEAITGTKDAVDGEGNPDYQGIDQSKLVPLLVKTIQELEARIATLEG